MDTQIAETLFTFGGRSMVYSFDDFEFLLNQSTNLTDRAREECDDPDACQICDL